MPPSSDRMGLYLPLQASNAVLVHGDKRLCLQWTEVSLPMRTSVGAMNLCGFSEASAASLEEHVVMVAQEV